MTQETTYYEISYWLTPSIAEDQAASMQEELRALLDAHDASVESWDSPKRRHLAYPIRKETEGYFGAFRFTAPSTQANTISKKMRDHKTVLRSMLLEWHRHVARPYQPKMAPKEDRVPTDEGAIDKKLEEILGSEKPVTEQSTNESK